MNHEKAVEPETYRRGTHTAVLGLGGTRGRRSLDELELLRGLGVDFGHLSGEGERGIEVIGLKSLTGEEG